MGDLQHLDFIEEQLTSARRHLIQTAGAAAGEASVHIDKARSAYESVMSLLPRIKLSTTRRIGVATELAGLRSLLRGVGEDV
jgi:hypothetical protein